MEGLVVNKGKIKSKVNARDLIFCVLLLIWPTIQFAIFYIGVNFNSILMIFQKFDISGEVKTITTSFDAFKVNWNWCMDFFKSQDFINMVKMSLLCWACSVFIGTPLGLLFSYYIAKKMPGAQFFRIVLYLPSIISGLILVLLYSSFIDIPFSEHVLHLSSGLLNHDSKSVRILVVCAFNIWVGFGTSVLMYANSMSAISPEILESASLDGAKGFKEFIHIVFPMVFPTFSVFFVTTLATIFTNQANLYSFYGTKCPTDMQTIGYYLFKTVKSDGYTAYPRVALLGIVFSLIAIPVTLITRKLLEKYGPSTK